MNKMERAAQISKYRNFMLLSHLYPGDKLKERDERLLLEHHEKMMQQRGEMVGHGRNYLRRKGVVK